jgi:hypothetical protein
MTRDASQPWKYFLCKIKVGLVEHTPVRVIGMAVGKTEVVFENETEGSPGGLGYMQEYDHSITQGLGTELTETHFYKWG